MKTPNLLVVPKNGLTWKERVKAFKYLWRIWTYHSAFIAREDEPWSALLMTEGCSRDPIDVIAGYAIGLEASGDLVTGKTEVAAIRELCARKNIPCPL